MAKLKNIKKIHTVGVAACFGGSQTSCANAPFVIQSSEFNRLLSQQGLALQWQKIISPGICSANSLRCFNDTSLAIAKQTYQYCQDTLGADAGIEPFLVLSGDHSSAVGTWAGVMQAMEGKRLGLIWVDAHLDAHTLETSPSGNLHGMPLSVLLNKADKKLQACYPTIGPNQACYLAGDRLSLLGARSYESAELALLNNAKACIVDMPRLLQDTHPELVLNKLAEDLLKRCDLIGISLDLDAICPKDAPAVETPEKDGISAQLMISMLDNFAYKDALIGFEITEFNPISDVAQKTEKLVLQLISRLFRQ